MTATLLAAMIPVAAAAAPRLAVLELRGPLPAPVLQLLGDDVRAAALAEARGYEVITRENVIELLRASGKADLAACEGECEVEIGRNLGADLVATGGVVQVDETLVLALRLHETAKGALLATSDAEGATQTDLRAAVRPAAKALFRRGLAAGGGGPGAGAGRPGGPANAEGPPATVRVLVTPAGPGTVVRLDGVPKGALPRAGSLTFAVSPGPHEVRVERAGHEALVSRVQARQGEVATVSGALASRAAARAPKGGAAVLTVRSTPTGAAVLLDGQETGRQTPYTFDGVAPGAHTVELRLPLHHPAAQRVDLSPGEMLDLRPLRLDPAFGGLRIDSEPTGAQVSMDGNPLGTTPFARERLPSGEHRIQVVAPLHRPAEERFTLRDGETFARTFRLRPAFGRIRVASDPAGAAVLLDGSASGATPVTLERVPSGPHTLVVEAPFHRPRTETLDVQDGADLDRTALVLVPHFATLAVDAGAVPARVLLDGADIGPAPTGDVRVEPGVHEVEVRPDDPRWRPHRETPDLPSGMRRQVRPDLQARTGSVLVTTDPPDAAISIDGEKAGASPLRREGLLMGKHRVRATAPGRTPAAVDAEVREGETARVRLDLPTRGALAVHTGLEGVEVKVQGRGVGVAPVRLADLDDGGYAVRCDKEGHLPKTAVAMVEAGREAAVQCDLLPRDLVAEERASKGLWGVVSLVGGAGALAVGGYLLVAAVPDWARAADEDHARYEKARTGADAAAARKAVEEGVDRQRMLAVVGWSLLGVAAAGGAFGVYELATMPSMDGDGASVSVRGAW